ncbi:hypothetical protein JTE90_014591 [Oedothorax gibbosus]|uniref:Uncharacterized protein n=1 Tax=Oedothorax gibbosus TaxID=931172 RepID=A0AAV6TEZ4_9ARAC|nr:hypothetical protein JTE90_014591 [Oedothorax gibbosus]
MPIFPNCCSPLEPFSSLVPKGSHFGVFATKYPKISPPPPGGGPKAGSPPAPSTHASPRPSTHSPGPRKPSTKGRLSRKPGPACNHTSPEPKSFGFPGKLPGRGHLRNTAGRWLASFMVRTRAVSDRFDPLTFVLINGNILANAFAVGSSCDGPRISPLASQYECPPSVPLNHYLVSENQQNRTGGPIPLFHAHWFRGHAA